MQDLQGVTVPRDVFWAHGGWPNWLLFVYDWDSIILNPNITASVTVGVDLCTDFFPCSVYLKGVPRGFIEFTGSGYISCLASDSCLEVTILDVSILCQNRYDSISVLKIQGSALNVSNTSFSNCQSSTDGGVIQSYDLSIISIYSCRFHDIHSDGFGGAISSFGGSLSVSDSVFSNCSSRKGGGSIWSSAFQGCYGSIQPFSTTLGIQSSVFYDSATDGAGGALLAESPTTPVGGEALEVTILSSTFSNCRAGEDGGALRTSGASVRATLKSVNFIACVSVGSGGAISASDFSSLSLISSLLIRNSANGLGGGAIHVNESSLLLYNTSITDNSAPLGGGGVLFWQGTVYASNQGCPTGSKSAASFCPFSNLNPEPSKCTIGTCTLCSAGYFQEANNAQECFPCHMGAFAETAGKSVCAKCPVGTYSSFIGSNSSGNCLFCAPGKYTDMQGSSSCSACLPGQYNPSSAGQGCLECTEGHYSGSGAAWCSQCVVGLYTENSYTSQRYIPSYDQCSAQTEQNGTIGRIVPKGNYRNNELMYWIIAPFNSESISLTFSVFNTEQNHDFVYIYACPSVKCSSTVLLSSLSGSKLPETLRYDAGVILIVWTSDDFVNSSGWVASFQGYSKYFLRTSQAQKSRGKSSKLESPKLIPNSVLVRLFRFRTDDIDVKPFLGQVDNTLKVGYVRGRLKREHVSKESKNLGETAFRGRSKWQNSTFKITRHLARSSLNLATANEYYAELFSPDAFCGNSNIALYGGCIASGYSKLTISASESTVYAGVPFNLTVTKIDAYENVILSDSSSVLQVVLASDSSRLTDTSVSIVGSSLAQLSRGVAQFLFAVQPTFSKIDVLSGLALINNHSYFYLEGSDSQAPLSMISDLVILNLHQGQTVCPSGDILVPYEQGATSGPAVCQTCKPGTYSIHPLARALASQLTPSCIDCPAAGMCTKGGNDVQFKVGNWTEVNGMYVLTNCPSGHQLVNSTAGTSKGEFSNVLQECKPCLQEQYILNPSTDSCQPCPPGLKCSETASVTPVVQGSTWTQNGSIYLLTGCPAGYSVLSYGVSAVFDASLQQCSPCPKGAECVTPPCKSCSPCKQGFYKAAAGVDGCVPCPPDTYNVDQGGQALSICQHCQSFGSTQGRTGQTSQSSCICDKGYYSVLSSSLVICAACPTGALCPDGACAVLKSSALTCPGGDIIVGAWTIDNATGLYALNGCPPGYFLNSEQCQICPAMYYCSGGTLPSTPCASGQFSLPGSTVKGNCSPSVFVVLIITLPILRPFFTDQTSMQFQTALAYSASTDSAHVIVDIVQSGNDPTTTEVSSRIATSDALAAASLVKGLDPQKIQARLQIHSFQGASLTSVEVTACIPGFELQAQPPPSTCQPCPSNSYCLGGTDAHVPCPDGSFSGLGANSSSACKQAAVMLGITLPITSSNFTSDLQFRFRNALASTVGVKTDLVTIVAFHDARRAGAGSLLVTSEIAAESPVSAQVISSKVETSSLNSYLKAYGLPESSSASTEIKSIIPVASSGSSISLPAVIGGCIGGFIFMTIVISIGHRLVKVILKQRADNALHEAFKNAKAGKSASMDYLPIDLRKHFVAESVLGKGAYGCVVQAKKKGSNESVAIKIIMPEKGSFDEKTLRQLKREEIVLRLFTAHKCEHAVMLAGLWAVEIRKDICWFIMDLLEGDNMEDAVHGNTRYEKQTCSVDELQEHPVTDVECIKAARGVLAALKIMHAEGVVHRDVKPANIVRCRVKKAMGTGEGSSYTYKLIDFGSALGIDETVAKEAMMTLAANRGAAAGTPPYMSPEMFKEPERASYPTDIWSLGVTMFELVTTCLPFQSDSDLLWSFAIAGNMDEKAPNVLDLISEDRRSTFDNNLAKAIAKALEKKVSKRFASADEMHEAVYSCLIARGEGCYSAFISYRVASEAPLARILFDELNHSVTPGGHRVTVYWDAQRLVEGEDWEDGFGAGLLNSLCFLPLLSYGATAPLGTLPKNPEIAKLGWEERPFGKRRLEGAESDPEDNVLKELLIAGILLEMQRAAEEKDALAGASRLQLAYPILIGRQQPPGHPQYPRMGSFFDVQGGGGSFPDRPSPPTARAVSRFLHGTMGVTEEAVQQIEGLSVESVVRTMTQLQGCQLWDHPQVICI